MNQNSFYSTLDGIRGVAAILIVIRHSEFFFTPFIFRESYLGVDLFFVLSGVVICQAYEEKIKRGLSIFEFTVIRLIRIYPLYLFGSIVGFIDLMLTKNGYQSNNYSLFDIICLLILSIFMLPNPGVVYAGLYPLNGPAWSLLFEILANVMFAYKTKKFPERLFRAVVFLFAGLIGVCIYLVPYHNISGGSQLDEFPIGLARVMYSFFMGTLIYKGFRLKNCMLHKNAFTTCMAVLVLSLTAIILTWPTSQYYQPFFDFFCVVLLFPVLVYIALLNQPLSWGEHICRFLGLISYPMYILCGPFVTLSNGIVQKCFHITASDYAPWSGLIFVSIFVCFCLVIDKHYDLPLRSFLNSKRKRRKLSI